MISTPAPSENPFASHRVRPGALPFLFPRGQSAHQLVEGLANHHWRGQIIGPHGSGKSTLLWTLLPHLESSGRGLLHGVFHGGRFTWLSDVDRARTPGSRRIVVIDGFERLGLLRRIYWKLCCWQRGDGLLVTAHRDMGLPTLYQTQVTPNIAQRVADQLLAEGDANIHPTDVDQALAKHPGDLRSTLFALYDLYEARHPR